MNCKCFTLVMACLAAAGVKGQTDAYDYCDPSLRLCEVASEHTMCKYPIPGLSPQCTPGVQEPLNSTEKDRILFLHNKFRSYVAEGTEKSRIRKLPPASNMRQLYWDRELENIAMRWAEQCVKTTSRTYNDKCRNTKRFQVSQNVGTRRVNGSTIDKQAPQIVITWYKESKDFVPALVDNFTPDEDAKLSVKQFANLIWGDTHAVGCARIIFQEQLPNSDKDPKAGATSMIERLVCNYGPGGSEIGRPIYKRGTPCESCPPGTKCSSLFPGLCATLSLEKARDQEPKGDAKASKPDFTTDGLEGDEERMLTKDPSEGDCEGADCLSENSPPENGKPNLNQLTKNPRPTARKNVGFVEAGHGDDMVTEKRKWFVTKRKKVRREDLRREGAPKTGDSCNCYVASEEESGSSRVKQNIFLLLFSPFFLYYFEYFFCQINLFSFV